MKHNTNVSGGPYKYRFINAEKFHILFEKKLGNILLEDQDGLSCEASDEAISFSHDGGNCRDLMNLCLHSCALV